MKCPQLSKPEATTARNQNSIGDRKEKKKLINQKPGSARGPVPLLPDWTSSLFQLQQSQIVRAPLVPVVFSRWLSRWRGPHWRSVSGAHLGALVSSDVQSCRGRLKEVLHHIDLDMDWICWLQWSSGLDKDPIGWLPWPRNKKEKRPILA